MSTSKEVRAVQCKKQMRKATIKILAAKKKTERNQRQKTLFNNACSPSRAHEKTYEPVNERIKKEVELRGVTVEPSRGIISICEKKKRKKSRKVDQQQRCTN